MPGRLRRLLSRVEIRKLQLQAWLLGRRIREQLMG